MFGLKGSFRSPSWPVNISQPISISCFRLSDVLWQETPQIIKRWIRFSDAHKVHQNIFSLSGIDIGESCNPCSPPNVRPSPHEVFTRAQCDESSFPIRTRAAVLESATLHAYGTHHVRIHYRHWSAPASDLRSSDRLRLDPRQRGPLVGSA